MQGEKWQKIYKPTNIDGKWISVKGLVQPMTENYYFRVKDIEKNIDNNSKSKLQSFPTTSYKSFDTNYGKMDKLKHGTEKYISYNSYSNFLKK